MGPLRLRATGFLLHNRLNLFSNFTFFLDDPITAINSSRPNAASPRAVVSRIAGSAHFLNRHTESAVGVQLRRDWIDPVVCIEPPGGSGSPDPRR